MYIAYSPDKIHKDIGQTRQLVIDPKRNSHIYALVRRSIFVSMCRGSQIGPLLQGTKEFVVRCYPRGTRLRPSSLEVGDERRYWEAWSARKVDS